MLGKAKSSSYPTSPISPCSIQNLPYQWMKRLKVFFFFWGDIWSVFVLESRSFLLSAVKLKYWSESEAKRHLSSWVCFSYFRAFFGDCPLWGQNGIGPCNLHMALASVVFLSLALNLSLSLSCSGSFLAFRWSLLVLISCSLLCCLCAIFTFQKKKHKRKKRRKKRKNTWVVKEEERGNKRPSS